MTLVQATLLILMVIDEEEAPKLVPVKVVCTPCEVPAFGVIVVIVGGVKDNNFSGTWALDMPLVAVTLTTRFAPMPAGRLQTISIWVHEV